jgi:(R,R)-butanediol dehydrogenase/meso-butanediol dehydrogenase/diacetyl reductase
MKVAVLSAVEELTLEERPIPKVEPEGGLVRVEVCGICGSDLHAYLSGEVFPVGTVMGHECAGTVVETGKKVERFESGDRVAIFGATTCGTCPACRRGLSHHCEHALERAIGCSTHLDGAFAEYVYLPYLDEMVVPMPDALTFEAAALADPLSSALHPVRISSFRPGDMVAVLGAGPIGLMTIQMLRLGGAGRIIVTEPSHQRAGVARELGADIVLDPIEEGEDLASRVAELTGGLGVDVAFECSGVPVAFRQAFGLVRPGGQIMAVGIIEQETSILPLDLVFHEIDLKGSMMYTRHEFSMAVDLLAAGRIRTSGYISDRIQLAEIETAGFERLRSSPDVVKILVNP